jgi:hypothetical protein
VRRRQWSKVEADPALKRLIRKSQLLVAEKLSSFCNEGLDLPIGVPRCVIPGGLAANPNAPPTLSWTGQETGRFAERMGAIRLKADGRHPAQGRRLPVNEERGAAWHRSV